MLDQLQQENGEKNSIESERNYEKTADRICGKHVLALYAPISGEMSGWYAGTGFCFFILSLELSSICGCLVCVNN